MEKNDKKRQRLKKNNERKKTRSCIVSKGEEIPIVEINGKSWASAFTIHANLKEIDGTSKDGKFMSIKR